MSLLAGGAVPGRLVPKHLRKKRLAAFGSQKDAEVAAEKADLLFALSLIGGYYAVGVVAYAYNLERGWTVNDALYFATATMTTVGFGDLVPTSRASRQFTAVYALFGVCLVAVALQQVIGFVVKQRDALLAAAKKNLLASEGDKSAKLITENPAEALRVFKRAERRRAAAAAPTKRPSLLGRASGAVLLRLGSGLGSGGATFDAGATFDGGATVDSQRPPPPGLGASGGGSSTFGGCRRGPLATWRRWGALFPILRVVRNLAAYVLATGLVFAQLEGLSAVDGMYYAVISGTTVGYGDVAPVSPTGRGVALLWLPLSVVVVGNQLASVGSCFFGDARGGALEKLLHMDLSLAALLSMDEDGDGEITEFEFLRFMLSQADITATDIVDSLHARFQAMDTDGSGALTRDDLVALATHPGGNPGGGEPFGGPATRTAADALAVARGTLGAAVAATSSDAKAFAKAAARALQQTHRRRVPRPAVAVASSYDALLAHASSATHAPQPRKQPSSGSVATNGGSNGKGGSPRAHGRYHGFGGEADNSRASFAAAGRAAAQAAATVALVAARRAPPVPAAQAGAVAGVGRRRGGERGWFTFGRAEDVSSDSGSSDCDTQL